MSNLKKYQHNAQEFYDQEAANYLDLNVDFFSCYENNRKESINCESTFKNTFLGLLEKIKIEPDWNFLDVGCGLGHPMYLASPYFEKVFGIEVDPEITKIAKQNLNNMNAENFTVINSDIKSIDEQFFDNINVFYLFNPFTGETFDIFLQKLLNSIEKRREEKRREVWVIYANAVCEEKFEPYRDILLLKFSEQNFRKVNFYQCEI